MFLGVVVGILIVLMFIFGMCIVMGGFGLNFSIFLFGGFLDLSVIVGGYKMRLCNKFSIFEGCWFGDKCYFVYGESDLWFFNVCFNGVDYLVLFNFILK